MLNSIFTRFLQHLMQQNSWAKAILQPFAGQSVLVTSSLLHTTLIILEDGSLVIAGQTNLPDATISIAPSLLLRIMAKDESAKLKINITGDTHLAAELGKVFTNMRWDIEEDLSKLIGDISANKLTQFNRQAIKNVKETGTNLAEMLTEYWQEENPLIAKKYAVEEFCKEVDKIRADVARFEKKLQKFSQPTLSTTNQ